MGIAASEGDSSIPNHPKSILMAFIAWLTFSVVIGSIMGTRGVLLKRMADHLDVTPKSVSLGMLSILIASSFFAPQIGTLAVRHSLRKVLFACGLLLSAFWFVQIVNTSYPVYLASCAFLLGPSMAIGGSILAPTLVTRWFNRNRGLAVGIVHLPFLVAALPITCAALFKSGVSMESVFLGLAILPLVTLVPASFFVIDWPPGQEPALQSAEATPGKDGEALSIAQLVRDPRLWLIALAAGVPNTSSTVLGEHLVEMAKTWNIEEVHGAGLAAIMSVGGLAGSVLVGMLADRIGGARTLMVIALCDALLWPAFLLGLPFGGLIGVVAAIGFFGAGTVPAFTKAFTEAFGRTSFSRAVGLMVPITFPLLFAGLYGTPWLREMQGNYGMVVLVMAALFVGGALCAATAAKLGRATNPA